MSCPPWPPIYIGVANVPVERSAKADYIIHVEKGTKQIFDV
jgi:hypothetical protein